MGLAVQQNAKARGYYENKIKGKFVIKIKRPYDIASNKQRDGSFGIRADLWEGYVEKEVRKDYGKLLRLYRVQQATLEAKKGLSVLRRPQQNGSIKLVFMGVFMDEKQKAECLADDHHCPYCKSEYIAAQEFDTESITQSVECMSCSKQWRDVHTLTDFEPIESTPVNNRGASSAALTCENKIERSKPRGMQSGRLALDKKHRTDGHFEWQKARPIWLANRRK